MKIEKSGFKICKRESVDVNIEAGLRIDAAIELGSVSESSTSLQHLANDVVVLRMGADPKLQQSIRYPGCESTAMQTNSSRPELIDLLQVNEG